jgi:hypothetical protein
LAECGKVDECKDWADKAAALGSYAKQSGDKSLFNLATRIQARAIRRCGELLKEFEAKSGARTDLEPSNGDGTRLETRKSAAEKRRTLQTTEGYRPSRRQCSQRGI